MTKNGSLLLLGKFVTPSVLPCVSFAFISIAMVFTNTNSCYADGGISGITSLFTGKPGCAHSLYHLQCKYGLTSVEKRDSSIQKELPVTSDTLPCGSISESSWTPFDAFLFILDSSLTADHCANDTIPRNYLNKPTCATTNIWPHYNFAAAGKPMSVYTMLN